MERANEISAKKLRHHAFQWHITHRCNLRCAHCYQEDYQAETDREAMISTLDKYERFLKKNDLYGHVFLTGGEPLVHSSFFFICEEIKRRGMMLSVMTNGTLIGTKEANRIAFLDPDYVQISLDGTPGIHDAVRGAGSFDCALTGIDRLKEEGVRVIVSFTAQKNNLRCFGKLAEICKKHGVDKLWWDRVVTEKPEDAESLALSTEEFKKIVKTAGRLNIRSAKKNSQTFVSCERSLQFLGRRGCGDVYKCKAGGDMIVILADGSVMPCRRLPFVIGNITDGELDEIISSSSLMKELRESPLPRECTECRHADRCGGGAKCVTYGQTGELYAKDVNCYI